MTNEKVKGTVIIPSVEYIKKKYGDSKFNELVGKLSPESQKVLKGSRLASTWYDVSVIIEYLTAINNEYGMTDKNIIENIGAASADYGAKGVYRVFLMVTSPVKVVKMSPHIWSKYYSFGDMKIIELTDHSATLHLVNTKFSNKLLCRRITGWMKRVLESTGGKNVVLKHTKCISNGAPYEEYKATWS